MAPPRKEFVPDAWDDDWEPDAGAPLNEPSKPDSPLTKAQALARHEESNRKLWQTADSNKDDIQFLPATNNVVPQPSAFKPPMKVLSRRPAPGQEGDGDDEPRAAAQPTPEEIRLRQQREREEKQRKYDEARAKIFGEPAPPQQQQQPSGNKFYSSSGASTPGNVTPPQQQQTDGFGNGGGRPGQRGRGRGGRGGGGGGFRGDGINGGHNRGGIERGSFGGSNNNNNNYSQGADDLRRPPAQPGTRELFDPNSSPRPSGSSSPFTGQRRGGGDASGSPRSGTPREEDQIIRSPRGPDSSGRGGFGFARRGSTSRGG